MRQIVALLYRCRCWTIEPPGALGAVIPYENATTMRRKRACFKQSSKKVEDSVLMAISSLRARTSRRKNMRNTRVNGPKCSEFGSACIRVFFSRRADANNGKHAGGSPVRSGALTSKRNASAFEGRGRTIHEKPSLTQPRHERIHA